MSSIRQQFSDNFSYDYFGRITGTFLISRFPDIHGRLARLKADPANAGNITFGDARSTGMFPMPWMLAPGDDTGWFALSAADANDTEGNLSVFYQRASSGSSYFAYWIQA